MQLLIFTGCQFLANTESVIWGTKQRSKKLSKSKRFFTPIKEDVFIIFLIVNGNLKYTVRGWIVLLPQNTHWSSNPKHLRIWPYLQIGLLKRWLNWSIIKPSVSETGVLIKGENLDTRTDAHTGISLRRGRVNLSQATGLPEPGQSSRMSLLQSGLGKMGKETLVHTGILEYPLPCNEALSPALPSRIKELLPLEAKNHLILFQSHPSS